MALPLPDPALADGPPPRDTLGEGFSCAAIRLAGLAGLHFGWTPGTFWAATPAELATLMKAITGDSAEAVDGGDLARLMEIFPDG